MLRRSNRNRTSALPSRWLKFVEIILIEVQEYLQAGNNGHGCGLGLWIQFDWTAWLGAIDTILESTWVVSSASGLTTHSPSISSDGRDPLAKLGTKWGWRVLAGVGCPVFWRTNCLLRSSIVGPAYPHTIYWGLKIDTFPGSACLCKVLCAFSSIPPV